MSHDATDQVFREWNPTPERFQAYLAREVQLAKQNIAHLQVRGSATTNRHRLPEPSLHSVRTLQIALSELGLS